MKKLDVEMWSDVVCPWCWIGKRHLEAALAKFPHRDAVSVHYRAFELDPSASKTPDAVPVVTRLAKKYGKSTAEAQAMVDRVAQVAKQDGLDMRFETAKSGNTFDAHRLLHLAGERGRQEALKERLLKAHFTDGEVVADPAVLTRHAVAVGLDADEVTAVLASDTYADAVRADQDEARESGVSGVPFFAMGRYGISGAQPAEVLLRALEKAWEEAAEVPAEKESSLTEGAVCGPDGCALVHGCASPSHRPGRRNAGPAGIGHGSSGSASPRVALW
jgi:predicted DsbA family dithiol-disulfide isomerase